MNRRRVAAGALILLMLVLLSVLERDGGSTDDTSGSRPTVPPSAPHLPCDGPSPEVVRRSCGVWREPHTRTVTDGDVSSRVTLWELRRGPLRQAPPRARVLSAEAFTESYRADPPDLPSAPVNAPWVFTHWWLALPLMIGVMVGARALFNPPWRSRASRET